MCNSGFFPEAGLKVSWHRSFHKKLYFSRLCNLTHKSWIKTDLAVDIFFSYFSSFLFLQMKKQLKKVEVRRDKTSRGGLNFSGLWFSFWADAGLASFLSRSVCSHVSGIQM